MNDFRKMMKIDYYDLSLRLIGLYLHPMDANISKNLSQDGILLESIQNPKMAL